MPISRPATVAIVGAGAVGSTLAYAVLTRGLARRLVLHDINPAKVEAEALDLSHGIQFVPMAQVEGSDDIAVCADADVVVVTAGAKQKPGQTRMDLAQSTVGMMRQIMPRLVEVAPNALYLMVTNPVDVVTYAALQISGLPPNQLFGSGTVLDSSRLRVLIGQECGISVQSVHAYIAGEHGDSETPLWSSAFIGGMPLLQWEQLTGKLGEQTRENISHEVVNAAYRVIEGKGATNYAIGLAGAKILEAVLRDEHRVLPVSTLLDDWHGISDVCMSVPTVVDRRGAAQRLPLPVSEAELAKLRSSAGQIRAQAKSMGF